MGLVTKLVLGPVRLLFKPFAFLFKPIKYLWLIAGLGVIIGLLLSVSSGNIDAFGLMVFLAIVWSMTYTFFAPS